MCLLLLDSLMTLVKFAANVDLWYNVINIDEAGRGNSAKKAYGA